MLTYRCAKDVAIHLSPTTLLEADCDVGVCSGQIHLPSRVSKGLPKEGGDVHKAKPVVVGPADVCGHEGQQLSAIDVATASHQVLDAVGTSSVHLDAISLALCMSASESTPVKS